MDYFIAFHLGIGEHVIDATRDDIFAGISQAEIDKKVTLIARLGKNILELQGKDE